MGNEFRIKTSEARSIKLLSKDGLSPGIERKIHTSNERPTHEYYQGTPPTTAHSGKVYSLGGLSILSSSPKSIASPQMVRTGENILGVKYEVLK